MQRYKTIIYDILKPYSAILFLNNKIAGLLILAITFINPSIALSGMIAVVFTIVFAKFIDISEEYLYKGFYIYNSLLVGMGIGYIFYPSFTSVVLIAICSSLTFMFSFMLNRLFSIYKIPILSLPFSIVTMFIYLASLKYSGLLSNIVNNATIYDIQMPLIISGFLKSFGTIFFLPNNIAGFLLLLVVLSYTRVIFFMAVVGYYFGVMLHGYLIGSFQMALYNPFAFNFILVAIALCGIFLLPTIKNFVLSLIGVAISVILTDSISILFNYYGIPVFTLPFNFTVIIFIFILSITYYKEFNYIIKDTPEKSLSRHLSHIFRFGAIHTKIAMPFSGQWEVYQGFNDKWTHQGKYSFAYDFVKTENGISYKNDGVFLDDYYCFGEAVLAPVSGYIVDCKHDLPDNHIGEVDRVNNWGNYIIIKSDLGFFVEISHIMQYSLNVKVGDYVKINTIIAKCGNSGYSPQPHIHIQVQDVGVIGGFTKEFCFSQYLQDNQLVFNSIPKKGEQVTSTITNKSISSRFLFILDDILRYDVYANGVKIKTVEFIVKMDENSEFYFEDEENNRLYFYNDLTEFYFYNYIGKDSYLKYLFIVLPRLPFIDQNNITYKDFLPVNVVKSGMQKVYIELISTILHNYSKIERTYTYNDGVVLSENGKVILGTSYNSKGFEMINYQNIELKRIDI